MAIKSSNKDFEKFSSMRIQEDPADDECLNNRTHFYEFKEKEAVRALLASLPSNLKVPVESKKSFEKFTHIVECYKEQCHLIDSFLAELLENLFGLIKTNAKSDANTREKDQVLHETCKYMYTIANIRGYKRIGPYLPHEAEDIELSLDLLCRPDLSDKAHWQTKYMLLLLLSSHLLRLDALLVDRVIKITTPCLFSNDKCQDACAFTLAVFMSHHDVPKLVFADFFQQLFIHLQTANKKKENVSLLGVLKCISAIYKYGKREDLLAYTSSTLKHIFDHDLLVSNRLAAVRKYCIKILQRIGMTLLNPEEAKYQHGLRTIEQNVEKQPQKVQLVKEEAGNKGEEVAKEIDQVIKQLLDGLKDNHQSVRWSSAKGIGRITSQLSKDKADEVLISVLNTFSFSDDDSAWHGGCLTIAELSQHGLLLPDKLSNVLPFILEALVFDKKLGNCSLGHNVRDAACFVCWSLARAFEADVIKPYVNRIASVLLCVTVFDKEVSCRRAASAAFQELIGRQGQFPHGIEMSTECDYVAVGQIQNCYLNLSLFVAQFDEYKIELIGHLIEHKLNHWDVSIRALCSQAIFKLAKICPDHMAFEVLPQMLDQSFNTDLNTRHGAILVLGELIHSLCEQQTELVRKYFPNELISKLKEVLSQMLDEKYFKNTSGELMRPSVCLLVRKLSISNLFQHTDTFDQRFLDECEKFLVECLENAKDTVQMAAVDTLPHFCRLYFSKQSDSFEKSFKLVDMLIERSRSTSKEYVRSGYCLALGNLPAKLLRTNSNFTRIVEELILASKCICGPITGQIQEKGKKEVGWILARRDAICAITNLLGKIHSNEDFVELNFTNDLIMKVFECFFHGLNDYSIDARGDSGSKVRCASIHALESLTELVAKHNLVEFVNNEVLIVKIFASILQQAVERIDRMRSVAGRTLVNLLYNQYLNVDKFAFSSAIKSVFTKNKCARIDWNMAQETLPMFAKLFSIAEFQTNLLLGFIYSIGSLTETLVKAANSSLLKQLQLLSKQDKQTYQILIYKILELSKKYIKNERLGFSLVKTIDLIIQNDFLNINLIDNHQIPNDFLTIFLENVRTTRDFAKLNMYINLFCDMIQFEKDRVRERALTQLMIMLCHQIGIIRVNTATKLFESLINYPELFDTDEESDQCVSLLTETVWDQEVDRVRPIRNQICDLLKLPRPVVK